MDLALGSKDGGKTWTQSRKTKLPNNNSGLDVAYLSKSKVLVLAYNHAMNADYVADSISLYRKITVKTGSYKWN